MLLSPAAHSASTFLLLCTTSLRLIHQPQHVVGAEHQTVAHLAEHPDTCSCGICSLVELAAPSRVYWTASRWQISINCTRARVTR